MSPQSTQPLVPAAAVLGVCLAIGLILGGYFVAGAIMESRRGDRTVTVRGLAEREVPADTAVWPITFRAAGNSLSELETTIKQNREAIGAFLSRSGFAVDEISVRPPVTVDLEAQAFVGPKQERPFRFVASNTVLVQSGNVSGVLEAMENIGELLQQGVVLGGDEYGNSRPEFIFSGLNEVKPAMLKEANDNARKAAAQFGDNAGTSVGAIRRAGQGQFEIRDRDSNSPDHKIIRVVTTVEYFLK
jgi:uncharacterized protein